MAKAPAMLHLPLAENRIAQFAARFEPLPTGDWAWFANDHSEGLLVTAAERADLIARHAAIHARLARVQRWWLPLAFLTVLALVFASRGSVADWVGPAVFALPIPYILWEWRRGERLPYLLTKRRMAVAPQRGLRRGPMSRLVVLPVTVPLLMATVGGALLGRLWFDGTLLVSPWMTAEGGMLMVAGVGILWLRRRAY